MKLADRKHKASKRASTTDCQIKPAERRRVFGPEQMIADFKAKRKFSADYVLYLLS